MSQLSLLEPRTERLDLPDADVRLVRGFLTDQDADLYFTRYQTEVKWRQDTITFYGKEHPLPRLQQWYGDSAGTYTYSGIRLVPQPWIGSLLQLKQKVEEAAGATFNTVLLNLYRDGDDTVSWHSDDEPELGKDPVIASLSLGVEREFLLKHNSRKDLKTVPVLLPHGSLLVMAGTTQAYWRHSLPRRKGVTSPRINLTFRKLTLSSF